MNESFYSHTQEHRQYIELHKYKRKNNKSSMILTNIWPTFKIVDLLSFPRGNLFALYPKVKISQLMHVKNIEWGYITILEWGIQMHDNDCWLLSIV